MLRFRSSQLLLILVFAAGLLVFGCDRAEADVALASWYGPGFQGLPTATAEHFNAYGSTVAHKTLPLGTELFVSYGGNTAWVVVNDREPYIGARDLDLSQGVAQQLGLIETGVAYVEVTYLRGPQTVEVPQALVIDCPAAVVYPPPETNVTQGLAHSASYAVQTGGSLSGISA
ncbi:MAG TPA: septal ring lytic transglycosylase RlpA family protein [Rubrobacteraceae bacterium]|nr:septal ring lytic transglycosylase RlpA family protein [Rubrobacteraceae bacterium]